MAHTLNALVSALDTLLVAVNDGGTPTHTHYFDHVWVGKPDKIPMGDKLVAYIEIGYIPTFLYTMGCPTNTQKDVDIYISIMSKGHVEKSHTNLYYAVDATINALLANDHITNSCISSTLEEVVFGDVVETQHEPKTLVTGARILLKCQLEGGT